MWWRLLGVEIVVGAAFVAAWYGIVLRLNRKRGSRILQWIDKAIEGHGFIAGVEWLSSANIQVRLGLSDSGFCQPIMLVQLPPRETPLRWLMSRLKRRCETLIFEANLPCPPSFNLEVQSHRWCGKTRRHFLPNPNTAFFKIGPMVISSRPDWQRDIRNMMESISVSRDCDFLQLRFGRCTPHFSATIPLTSLESHANADASIFTELKELASGWSASRY